MLFVYHVPSCRQSALAIYYVFLQQCQFRKPKTLHNNRVKALHSRGIQLPTCVPVAPRIPVRTRVRTYVRTYNVMSQLSDWKRAHMCTENHVCFGRIHGSQLREGANAGQHTPTLSLPPSHHCLDGEVYRGNRHYNVCEHVGLDTNQSLHHPPERDVLG